MPDYATGFDMTFELGLLECCRQHKVLVADLLRNCTIALPPRSTNSSSQCQSQTATKIQPTEPKQPDLWDENLPKWIDHWAWWRGILPQRFVALAPIAWSASQPCCALLSNRQSGKGIDSAKASTSLADSTFFLARCRNNGEASSPVTSWEYCTRNCVVWRLLLQKSKTLVSALMVKISQRRWSKRASGPTLTGGPEARAHQGDTDTDNLNL